MSESQSRPGGAAERERFSLDVVGIGALNLDYIVNASAFPGGGRAVRPLSGRVAALMEGAGAPPDRGIEVCTAEDFTGDGRQLARQNVVHEIGLFQGRHGFSHVILLVEEGCDFVPQAARPYTITFPHNNINRAFYKLAEMLRAQGLDPAEAR